MTKLEQTLLAIKDENLSKEQLDFYYSALTQLRADVRIEKAALLKEKALFMVKHPELSAVQRKINWDASEAGLRLFDLQAYVTSLGDAMEGVKTRIYGML